MKTGWFALTAILVLTACVQPTDSETLDYSTALETSIPPGQRLPGTDIQYLGKSAQGAQLSIGGQTAVKQMADSLTWHGEAAPGVNANYDLRIIRFDAKSLTTAGTATLSIRGANPKAVPAETLPPNALKFKGLVTYAVPKGKTIPGTTLSYVGKAPDGAQLGGIEGYPYRRVADSIEWTGQLTDRVLLDLGLRVVIFDDNSLTASGTANILLKP